MRKVYLDVLPKCLNGCIDWKNSEGYEVNFVYDNYNGSFRILSYDAKTQMVELCCNDKIYHIKNDSLRYGYVAQLTGKIRYDFLYEIGDVISDSNRNLEIISRHKGTMSSERYYGYKCNNCGWDGGTAKESLLKNGHGCSCCANRTVVKGINDIPTTDPWMIDYFQGGVDEASKYTSGSSQSIVPICPNCNTVWNHSIKIHRLHSQQGFSCLKCNDGYSYPEKFFYSLLKQVGCDFIMQFSRKDAGWVGSYRYDFGLPKYRHVIEIHGIQHYQNLNCFASKKRGRTLAEEMQNDKNKQELAIKNNFSYLSIDSRESTKKWMKNSIIQSGILEVLKVSIEDIDWDECNTFALSNLCKTICDYKNKNPKSTAREIAKIFHISGTTVASYLHIGNEIGLCHYNGLYKRIKMSKNNESVGIFNSASDIVKDKRFFDFSIACIGAVCRGKRKTYNGYNFEYI